jgi:hypothetical protein
MNKLEFIRDHIEDQFIGWFVTWTDEYETTELGIIRWHGFGKRYAFFPHKNRILHEECLQGIANFLIPLARECD